MSTNSKADPQAADDLATRLNRTELQRSTSSISGRDIVQVRTEIPAGVASGWHIHPGEEVGYIIAGTVQMEIQDRPTLVLHAGDPFLIPPRTPHNAVDLGTGTGTGTPRTSSRPAHRSRRSCDDRRTRPGRDLRRFPDAILLA
jgi:quercetin dioxygenase-like cupin family protein